MMLFDTPVKHVDDDDDGVVMLFFLLFAFRNWWKKKTIQWRIRFVTAKKEEKKTKKKEKQHTHGQSRNGRVREFFLFEIQVHIEHLNQ